MFKWLIRRSDQNQPGGRRKSNCARLFTTLKFAFPMYFSSWLKYILSTAPGNLKQSPTFWHETANEWMPIIRFLILQKCIHAHSLTPVGHSYQGFFKLKALAGRNILNNSSSSGVSTGVSARRPSFLQFTRLNSSRLLFI